MNHRIQTLIKELDKLGDLESATLHHGVNIEGGKGEQKLVVTFNVTPKPYAQPQTWNAGPNLVADTSTSRTVKVTGDIGKAYATGGYIVGESPAEKVTFIKGAEAKKPKLTITITTGDES